jgi:hypothetical protein
MLGTLIILVNRISEVYNIDMVDWFDKFISWLYQTRGYEMLSDIMEEVEFIIYCLQNLD